MAINTTTCYTDDIGSWQEVYQHKYSDRIKYLRDQTRRTPEVCLEHAMAEMKVYKETDGKDIPRVIERAMIFKTYLEDRTIFIDKGELLVGNICSKFRGSPWFGELYNEFAKREVDNPEHPELDPQVRQIDRHVISDEERKIIKDVIKPFFTGRTFEEYLYGNTPKQISSKAFYGGGYGGKIPNQGDLCVMQDIGHMFCNYPKVMKIGLNGIRKDLVDAKKRCEENYVKVGKKERLEWYEAALMGIDAVLAHSLKFAALAKEMAEKEEDAARKAELLEIARICEKVPANPAETWHEALQSLWFTHMSTLLEQCNYGNSFARFDQYMLPYYKASIDEIGRDQAMELLECFWLKLNSYTELYDFGTASVQAGFPLSQNLGIGGQLIDGSDGCNDVTMLCLDVDEDLGVMQPELAMRLWEGTPDEYLRRACEVVRLGRGKPKFYGDRAAVKMMRKSYPTVPDDELREFSAIGCIETALPYVTQNNSFVGLTNAGKLVELTLTNGRDPETGEQLGPMTGDPRTFESMEAVKTAFREQTMYWQEMMGKGMKYEMEGQGERLQLPFSSTLLEGPIEKGVDATQGGCWYTKYGILIGGIASAADSLCAIDTLVFKEKKLTMDELLDAVANNFEGAEEIRQMCINEVPKYGNDDDYADSWATYVCDVWNDSIDMINRNKDLIPKYGGDYTGAVLIGNGAVGMGMAVGALPDGKKAGEPLSDTMAPVQGRDVNGTEAVLHSVSKLPITRFAMGTALNQRFHPQLVANDDDITKFMDYMRTFERLGIHHIQFNIISSEVLKKAMKEPEKYNDLLIRVASYEAYYTELDPATQLDIIHRTEQGMW